MNCVECETDLSRNSPAVALCSMCGAGLCSTHARTVTLDDEAPLRHDAHGQQRDRPERVTCRRCDRLVLC
ncbi:hypothetical protein GALL_299330 [mine drainage metagenome]|uniref:DUF2180 family protein n=1 Tax=mine drainage metagenome TaxID=410659 RepID=A0A1J5QX99_9ZZZZ